MTPEEAAERDWLAEQPAAVRKLAEEFPIGSRFRILGKLFYLLGYTEDDRLIVSETDPGLDYDAACEQQQYLCAGHVRKGSYPP